MDHRLGLKILASHVGVTFTVLGINHSKKSGRYAKLMRRGCHTHRDLRQYRWAFECHWRKKVIVKRNRLTERRKTVGLSQERLAQIVGVDRSTVFRWEAANCDPQPWHRPNLAKALAVSLDGLNALLANAPPNHTTQLPAPLVMPTFGSIASADSVDELTAMQSFRMADRQVGGGHLYATVTGYLQHAVGPRLFGTNLSRNGSLFAGAAGLTEMAGWMAHDAGRDDAAARHFQQALGLASAGHDTQLGAHVFASLSHLSHHGHQPEQAVVYARRGRQRLAEGQPHHGVQARLFAMEARGHAKLGLNAQCTEHLRLAEAALNDEPLETQSPWVSQFDQAALAAEAARCFRDLGQLDSAKRHAAQVVVMRPAGRPRSRAFAQLMLASVLIGQGQIEEACEIARDVLHATQPLSSVLILQQLDQLGRALSQHRRAPKVAVFLGLLHEELTARRSIQWVSAQGTRTNGSADL